MPGWKVLRKVPASTIACARSKAGRFGGVHPRYAALPGVHGSGRAPGRPKCALREIAGNSQIILSVLAPQTWGYNNRYGKELFAAPLLTRPDKQRVVLGCEARALDQLLLSLRAEPVSIEHVYDY